MPFGPFSRLGFINYSSDFWQIEYAITMVKTVIESSRYPIPDVSGEWPINGIQDFSTSTTIQSARKISPGKINHIENPIFAETEKRTKNGSSRKIV